MQIYNKDFSMQIEFKIKTTKFKTNPFLKLFKYCQYYNLLFFDRKKEKSYILK